MLATIYRALDAVVLLLRLDANPAKCILRSNRLLPNAQSNRVKSRRAATEEDDSSGDEDELRF